MTLDEVLSLPVFAESRLVFPCSLSRPVHWVHVIDYPNPIPWARENQLILTTGYNFPRITAKQRTLIQRFAYANVAGLVLAVPQCFVHFPASMIEEAKTVELPLIEIPWEIPFAEITEQVHKAILGEQYQIIAQAERIHRQLTRAAIHLNSLTELTHVLGKLLGCSVFIKDVDGQLLAFYNTPQHEVCTITAGSPNHAYYEDIDYQDKICLGEDALRLPASTDGNIPARVVCAIRLHSEPIGHLWIIEGPRPLTEVDIRAAEQAAMLAALHIVHQHKLIAMEHKIGSSFLDSILEGRFVENAQTVEQARLLGFNLQKKCRVAVAFLGENLPLNKSGLLRREQVSADIRKKLELLQHWALLATRLDHICFLLSEEVKTKEFWEFSKKHKVALVVSEPVNGADAIRKAYQQIRKLLSHASIDPGRVHLYRDYLISRLFIGDISAKDELIDKLLRPLRRKHNTFMKTLFSLVENNFVFSKTAEDLGIHISTLRYRIERIENILKLDLDTPEARFMVRIAHYLYYHKYESYDENS